MASIKVKFRPSTEDGRQGTVYCQVIHGRRVCRLTEGYRVFAGEWDARRSTVNVGYDEVRRFYLLSVREQLRMDTERLARVVRRFDDSGLDYTVYDVVEEFRRYVDEASLFNFMEDVILRLRRNGKVRTSETYTAALNSFRKFRDGRDIMLDCVTSDVMEAYEAWLRGRGVTPNTVSFYTRILRAVYNRAVEAGIVEDRSPFRHVYTGVDKTVKRALPLSVLRNIKGLDLTLCPSLDFARDMFMMSFYLRGMSFIDMAYLCKTDLHNGYIAYRRRKTGQRLTIAWTEEMQAILAKYPVNPTRYLLPIIMNSTTADRNLYRNAGYNINRNLKIIASMVGVGIPLTLYCARHSWASAAKAKGIPVSVISEGMGHDSETTTQIYLASLDTSAVDKANSLILASL